MILLKVNRECCFIKVCAKIWVIFPNELNKMKLSTKNNINDMNMSLFTQQPYWKNKEYSHNEKNITN